MLTLDASTVIPAIALPPYSEFCSSQRLQQFLNSMPVGAYYKNSQSQMLWYNRFLCDRFQVSDSQWLGLKDTEFLGEQGKAFIENDRQVLATRQPHRFLETFEFSNGSNLYWQSHKFPIWDAELEEWLVGGLSIDITDIAVSSYQDRLTGLFNRRYLDEVLKRELERSKREKTQLGVVFIDIDNFKSYNDRYGYDMGDAVLVEVARIIKSSIRANDYGARFGGDEALALLVNTKLEGAYRVADLIRERIAELKVCDRSNCLRGITASIGVAVSDDYTTDLIKSASDAARLAKRSGKNQVKACSSTFSSRR